MSEQARLGRLLAELESICVEMSEADRLERERPGYVGPPRRCYVFQIRAAMMRAEAKSARSE